MRFVRPLPIAIVIPSFDPGGTERQMIELVRRLDPSRWEVHLACFRTDGAWFERAAAHVVSVRAFPVRSFMDWSMVAHVRRVADWCRDHRIALLHTSELYSNIGFLPGAALAGVPVRIGSRREISAGKSVAQLALQRAAYACAHRIVANAQAPARRLRREGVRGSRITVVPNGLDLDRVRPAGSRVSRRTVVTVANLRPEKGHDVLIDAAAAVLARFPDARFEFVGDGTQRAALEARARAAGVSHAVTFAGHCEDVPGKLASGDLFVLPSRSEAFPNAVLEAMAAGLPVVASGVGGILEVVEHGQTGLVATPGDPVSLADRICRLMTDPVLADRLAAQGRDLVASRYSFDRMVAAVDRLYTDELVGRAEARLVRSEYASL